MTDYQATHTTGDEILDSHDGQNLARLLTPRRYESISGHYGHPNMWVRQLVYGILSTAGCVVFGKEITMGQINILITTLGLYAQRMPYYFIGENFIRAVAATAIPKGMQFGELRWPLDAITFGLPVRFVKELTGCDVEIPFVSGALFSHRAIYDISRVFGNIAGVDVLPSVRVDTPRLTIIHADMQDLRINPEVCSCYGASYHLDMEVSSIDVSPHQIWSSFEGQQRPKMNLSPEAEAEVNRQLCALFVKLLLVLGCEGPRYIEPERQVRAASVKHGRVRSELWCPTFVGRSYVLRRQLGGTHASPRWHIRRRHIVRQAIGTRDKVIHIASLPHTTEGKVDWDAVTAEMKQAFWASHREIWVEPVIVKPETNDDDRSDGDGPL